MFFKVFGPRFSVLFLSLILTTGPAMADVEVGTGTSSMTGGRYVPSLDLAYVNKDQVFTWSATGVKSDYYFQSSHQIGFFKNWKTGTMWGGVVHSGFGGAAAYTSRGFQDEGSTTEQKESDFLVGPAVRMNLSYKMFYLNMSATFGLRNILTHLGSLTFQDVQSLSLGVRF